MTLGNMHKKHHWQVVGPTFNQLHLMYDKHFEAHVELVDAIAERMQAGSLPSLYVRYQTEALAPIVHTHLVGTMFRMPCAHQQSSLTESQI